MTRRRDVVSKGDGGLKLPAARVRRSAARSTEDELLAEIGSRGNHDTHELASALSLADASTQAGIVRRLQGTHGNASVQRLLASLPANPESDEVAREGDEADQVRLRAESVTGYDLSPVRFHRDSTVVEGPGVDAVTIGRDIHLAPGGLGPETRQGAHVLTHELAHVVQQGRGDTSDIAAAGRYEQLEADAESVAEQAGRVRGSRGSHTLPAPSHAVAQPFDPRWHRQSVATGLAGSGFTPEEIGQIYAANWERDFSQAHPALGAVVISWKKVKLAAHAGTLKEDDIKGFEGSIDQLLDVAMFHSKELLEAESYGTGYRFYEHMDNPGADPALSPTTGKGQETRGKLLVRAPGEKIPQYMVDSREYIKAQLFEAAQGVRGDMAGGTSSAIDERWKAREKELAVLVPHTERVVPGGAPARDVVGPETAAQAGRTEVINFEEGATIVGHSPNGSVRGPAFNAEVDRRFWDRTHYRVGERLREDRPEDAPYIRQWLTIRDEVRAERQAHRSDAGGGVATLAPPTPAAEQPAQAGQASAARLAGAGLAPGVADALGRASHALEDFWAHSNFVELAIGEPTPGAIGLATGSFGANDKKHALAHKIRGISDEIEGEMPLVNRVAGRTKDVSPEDVHLGDTARPAETDESGGGSKGNAIWTGLKTAGTILGGGLLGAAAGAAGGGLLGSVFGPVGTVVGAIGGGLFGAYAGLHAGTKAAIRNVVATPKGVQMLRYVAERIEESTREKAAPGSHTLLAKDQPAHEDNAFGRLKTIKFELAQDLSAAADARVIAPMKEVFEAATPAAAEARLQAIIGTGGILEQSIAVPGGNHPLQYLIDGRHEQAEKALQEYQAEQVRQGQLASAGG